MHRFKVFDVRTKQVVAFAENTEELTTALAKYPISGWHEIEDYSTGHRIGIIDGKIYDRDTETFLTK